MWTIFQIDFGVLKFVPTAVMMLISLGNEIWLSQIHHPMFVARAFPPIAHIHC